MKRSKTPKQRGPVLLPITLIFLSLLVVAAQPAVAIQPGDCFVIADEFNDNLGQINSSTGEIFRWLGQVVPGGGENLAIDPETLTLYNVAGEGGETALIIIDPDTANTTIINNDTGLWDVDGLAFAPDGILYAVSKDQKWDDKPGNLSIVDKNTGDVTFVVELKNPSPIPPDFLGADPHVDGISFHPTTGILYGIIGGYAKPSYLVTINMTTGTLTLVGGVGNISGSTGVDDIEDICFCADGTLYGTLGDQGALGSNASGSFEGLVTINLETAEATAVGPFDTSNPGPNLDVEAFACAVSSPFNPPKTTEKLPAFNLFGLIALIGLLSAVAFTRIRR